MFSHNILVNALKNNYIMETSGIFGSASRTTSVAAPVTDMVDIENGAIVISVVENRAREICICKINTRNNSLLEILILTDNHSYNEAICAIRMINPDEVLLHDGIRSGILAKKIEVECRNDSRILYISRQYFDQDRGADMLKKVLVGEVDGDLIAKYTVLSGAYCLLRYIENCGGFSYSPHSMRVEYGSATAAKMSIDRRTAVNLELISNARSGNQKESLFGAIDHTKTVAGGRLLRSNILRPSTDIPTINTRLDLVELFLRNNRVFMEVVAQLQQFPDLDKMLSGLTNRPKQVTQKTARLGIDTLIYLKQAVRTAPALAETLSELHNKSHGHEGLASAAVPPSQHPLVAAVIKNLCDPALQRMDESISEMITESTAFSKSVHEMRHQECFALRTGLHGLLDVARKTFLQTVEDLYRLAEKYSLEHGVAIKVSHSTSRGYFLSVPAALDPLPPGFTQAVLNKRSISCSTEEFVSLSDRADETITQALTLSHELIQTLLEELRQSIDALFTLTDSVALLDMLTSFADLVALSPHPFTRPVIQSDGPIVVKAGRHPVISVLPMQQLASSFVANDLFLSPLENLHVITGPNGSGKTVFIKQTALIVILAQIGCFVPAKHATVPIRDRILSRLGTSDDMEHNMSTFFTEMKESAYVLENLTDRSLVIIDELGRGTSTIDGLSIAFAIAEHLLDTAAMTLFVTHYPQITSLAQMYPNVKNVHLKTSLDLTTSVLHSPSNSNAAASRDRGSDQHGMKYLHEVVSGPCDMKSGYGILMAEQSGFSREVIDDAKALRTIVREKFPVLVQENVTTSRSNISVVTTLLQHILLLKNSPLDAQAMQLYLHDLRERIPDTTAQDIVSWLNSSEQNSNSSSSNTAEGRKTRCREAISGEIETEVNKVPRVENEQEE